MACVTTATTTELVATTVAATVTGFICCRINLFAGKCCAYAVCVVQILQRKCAGAKKKVKSSKIKSGSLNTLYNSEKYKKYL